MFIARARSNARRLALVGLGVAFLVAVACGGDSDDSATATTGSGASQTSTATPVRATPTQQPAAGGNTPRGTLVYAQGEVAAAVFDNSRIGGANSALRHWDVLETPLWWDKDNVAQNSLVESWSYDNTFTKLTFNLKQGVQFHGDWGEMTSADWLYTLESQGSDTSPRNYGLTTSILKSWSAPDAYTFVLELNNPDLTFVPFFIVNETFGAFTIWSKNRAETLGEEAQVTNLDVGTGPFRLTKYAAGDEAVMEAWNDDHHRKTPGFATLKVQAIPQVETQVAALRSGTVDVITLPITLAAEVSNAGFDLRERAWGGNWSLRIGGLYYATEYNGQALDPRPGYDPTAAWIGDINDPVSMENAKKVRTALAMAIDRDALVENLFEGRAETMFAPEILGPNRSAWASEAARWDYSYDPVAAKALLAEAGWANGFTLPFYLTTPPADLSEQVFEAMIRDWAAIGVDVDAVKIAGGTLTSEFLVPRNFKGIWLSGGSGGAVRQAEAVRLCRLPTASYNQGHELPVALDLCQKERNEPDPAKQVDILRQNLDYHVEWKTIVPLWEQKNFLAISDNVGAWPFGTAAETTFSDPAWAEPAN